MFEQSNTTWGNQDPRRSARVGLSAEIAVQRLGQRSNSVKIVNISHHGCKAEFVEPRRLDERVWVTFEGLEPLEAMVCWISDLEVGLEFENRIDPAAFASLIPKLAN